MYRNFVKIVRKINHDSKRFRKLTAGEIREIYNICEKLKPTDSKCITQIYQHGGMWDDKYYNYHSNNTIEKAFKEWCNIKWNNKLELELE